MSTLQGVVRDSAAAVRQAEVIALDVRTNQRRIVTANDHGFYRILGLNPGRYAVTVRVVGRSPVTRLVDLFAGDRVEVDFQLQQSANTLETVLIKERGSSTAVQRMSVSSTVADNEIQSLPLNTRNVMDLAALAPGIRSFQPAEGRSLPAAGSLRDERGLNLYLDGVEMKNYNSGNVVGSPQTGSPLPADGIEEMRVYLNPYDAEYARGASYVLSAVSHRGSNETHGSAFAFFQNKDLISVTDFQRDIPNFEKPDFRRQQMGLSVRGPVMRDRLFYAASYELSNTDTYIAVVPGKPPGDPSFWDAYAGVFKAPNQNHTGLLRLTYAANVTNALELIWSSRYMTGESRFGGTDARESAVEQEYAVNTLNLRHRWFPRSRISNELSLQFVGWSHENGPVAAGPELRYPTLTIGHSDAIFDIHEKQFRAAERLTYGFGTGPRSHLLKGGVEISRLLAAQYSPNNGEGSFRFRSETAEPYEAV
ncbi:MAG TPA: carboxypeptidase-like regulatory domain-containing protein, partial [Gemmatimonadaceae bacterium]|nr:carboxypeptidase-like regulatory domain-containing protein [Gemmatimonadaceae bacterium]